MTHDFYAGLIAGALVGALVAYVWQEAWHARAHRLLWSRYLESLVAARDALPPCAPDESERCP